METSPLLRKELPSNIDAERAILGAILLDNSLCHQAIELLGRGEDLFLASHRRIFGKMAGLVGRGSLIDLITLSGELRCAGEFEQVGGATYIASLIDGVPRTDNIEHYAKIIKSKSVLRNLIKEADSIIAKCIEEEPDPEVALAEAEQALASIRRATKVPNGVEGVYASLSELFESDLPESEEIISGVHRGEVSALIAVTNIGKSTLLLNTALSVAAGEACLPLAPQVEIPRRVMYIDFESPRSCFKKDLKTQLRQIRNASLACNNFIPVVEPLVMGEPLCLSRLEHLRRVIEWGRQYSIDWIIIDTSSAAFDLSDENSNAEVSRRVMKPLAKLAREAACAVTFAHHIGKSSETQSGESSYRGRGASAFGSLSRTVFTLEREPAKGEGFITLRTAKTKGMPFEPVLLKLDFEKRWFQVCADKPAPILQPPSANEIAEYVSKRKEAHSQDICKHFEGRASQRTISKRLSEAAKLGLIERPNRKAAWCSKSASISHQTVNT